ncbi:MAG: hypothetical protein ACT4PW_04765 [Acidimicrobiia bacterium]
MAVSPAAARPWFTPVVKQSIDFAFDDHAGDDVEFPTMAWSVHVLDDCPACEDLRVELLVEEVGRAGAGAALHLSPATARRLRAALATALREVGEDPG